MRSRVSFVVKMIGSFNTDNGIRRATILNSSIVHPREVFRFQYRQRYQEGYNKAVVRISFTENNWFQYRQRYQEGYNRSSLLVEVQSF